MACRYRWPKYFYYLYALLCMFTHFIATITPEGRVDKLSHCIVGEGALQRGIVPRKCVWLRDNSDQAGTQLSWVLVWYCFISDYNIHSSAPWHFKITVSKNHPCTFLQVDTTLVKPNVFILWNYVWLGLWQMLLSKGNDISYFQ